MSNHDLTIANGPGINVRQDIEAALQALGSNFFGPAVPLIAYPCQIWADSSAGLLRIRNTPNTAWITLGPLDTASFGMLPLTGGTITGNLTVNGTTNVATLNSAGHGVTGALNVSGGANFGSAVTAGGNFNVSVASGQNALYFSTVAGVRQWYSGCISTGVYFINDQTAGANRLTIDTAGLVTIAQGLTVNGNLSAQGSRFDVGGSTFLTTVCTLTAPAGQQAYYHSVVAGARDWIFGTQSDGTFLVYDASAGAPRLTISNAGLVNINQSATVGGNFGVGGGITAGTNVTAPGFVQGATLLCDAGVVSRSLSYRTNGSIRWSWQCDATAETGGGAGSNFGVNSWGDAGQNLGSCFSIVRSTRVVTFAVAIVNPSDRRLKSDVEPVGNALDLVEALEGVYYRKIADPERRQVGLIAQDVRAIFPEVVFETAETSDDGDAILGIEYGKLVPLLVNAVKELNARIATLEGAAR